jgi:hypothetical protein
MKLLNGLGYVVVFRKDWTDSRQVAPKIIVFWVGSVALVDKGFYKEYPSNLSILLIHMPHSKFSNPH